ncbi:phosphorylase family protein [Actinomadura napierensis]|uniref:Nucleoside phosphorylase domain-containing protein n=1 Tax=Actinomadura napierensis TaxID=267854 RepID=A0ABP5M0W5_9ACTN
MTGDDGSGLVVCAALRLEARAVRRGLARAPAVVVGYRARHAARLPDRAAVAVVGFGGALDGRLSPGTVVVADEIRGGGKPVPCPGARARAAELAGGGLRVHVGPLVTADRVVRERERHVWAADGACAVDMESARVAAALPDGTPVAALRVIVDGPHHPLLRPGTVTRGLAAWRVLARTGPALERWAAALA